MEIKKGDLVITPNGKMGTAVKVNKKTVVVNIRGKRVEYRKEEL